MKRGRISYSATDCVDIKAHFRVYIAKKGIITTFKEIFLDFL